MRKIFFFFLLLAQNCIIQNSKEHVIDPKDNNDNKNHNVSDSFSFSDTTINDPLLDNIVSNNIISNNQQKQKPLFLLQPGFDCHLNLFSDFVDFLSEFTEILILNPSDPKNYNQNEDRFAYKDACAFKEKYTYLGYGNIERRTRAAIKQLKILTNNQDLTKRPMFIAGYSQGGPTALSIYSALKGSYNIRGLTLISPSINGAEAYTSLTNPLTTIRIINWWLHDLVCDKKNPILSGLFWGPSAFASLFLTTLLSPVLNVTNLYFWMRGYGLHEFNPYGSNITKNYDNLYLLKENKLPIINIISSLQEHEDLIIVNKCIGSLVQKSISGPCNSPHDEVLTEENQNIDSNLYDNVCNVSIKARHGFNDRNCKIAPLATVHPQTLFSIAAQIICNDITGNTTKGDLDHFLNSPFFREMTTPNFIYGSIDIMNLLKKKKQIHKLIIDHICNDVFYKKN